MINEKLIIGKKFNRWTVLEKEPIQSKVKRRLYLTCQCECGSYGTVSFQNLKHENSKSCGCLKREIFEKEIIGKKIGKLTILGRGSKIPIRGEYYWNCRCDCGKNHQITYNNLTNFGSEKRTCGCDGYKIGELTRKKDRKKILFEKLYTLIIKTRGKSKRFVQREIKCDLPFESFKTIILNTCFYCGKEYDKIIEDVRLKDGRKIKISEEIVKYNGLDRIDSNLGYIENNVVACCRDCNVAKSAMTQQEFKNFVTKVYNHLTTRDLIVI